MSLPLTNWLSYRPTGGGPRRGQRALAPTTLAAPATQFGSSFTGHAAGDPGPHLAHRVDRERGGRLRRAVDAGHLGEQSPSAIMSSGGPCGQPGPANRCRAWPRRTARPPWPPPPPDAHPPPWCLSTSASSARTTPATPTPRSSSWPPFIRKTAAASSSQSRRSRRVCRSPYGSVWYVPRERCAGWRHGRRSCVMRSARGHAPAGVRHAPRPQRPASRHGTSATGGGWPSCSSRSLRRRAAGARASPRWCAAGSSG